MLNFEIDFRASLPHVRRSVKGVREKSSLRINIDQEVIKRHVCSLIVSKLSTRGSINHGNNVGRGICIIR